MFQKYDFTIGATISIVKNLRLATERTKHNSPIGAVGAIPKPVVD